MPMPDQLDLLERGVGEFGEGTAEVMRGNRQTELRGIFPHHKVDSVCRQPVGNITSLGDGPKEPAALDGADSTPAVDGRFGPGGYGHAAQTTSLPFHIDKDPAAFALLHPLNVQFRQFRTTQTATDQQGQQRPVALFPRRLSARGFQQRLRLFEGEPVAKAGVLQANGTAERDAALVMLEGIPGDHRVTVAADKGYDTKDFVAEVRNMNATPHVAQNNKGRKSAIDGRTTRHAGYAVSQQRRKRVEEIFGWMKTVGGMR
jgi:hypothetical protein